MTYLTRPAAAFLAFALLSLGCLCGSTAVNGQDKKESTKGAPVFKVPDGYMQAPLTDFRGTLVLHPNKAAGMFVTYPNDNETIEVLRQRMLQTIGRMFIQVEIGKTDTRIPWTTQSLPSHEGDGDAKATVNAHSNETEELQAVIYERASGQYPFLYGYFAMRHKKARGDDGKFLDEHGAGVKAFDKLWNSFPR